MQKAKIFSLIMLMAFSLSLFAVAPANAAAPNWDVTGDWVIRVYYSGSTYDHYWTLTMSPDGSFTGTGVYHEGLPDEITEVVTGTVDENTIIWHSDYDGSSYYWDGMATIQNDGTLGSGTWTSNAGQSGNCGSIVGVAEPAILTLTFQPGSDVVATIEIIDEGDLPPCVPPLPEGLTEYVGVKVIGSFSGIVTVAFYYGDLGLSPEDEATLRLYMADCVDFNDDNTVNGIDLSLIKKAIADGADPSYPTPAGDARSYDVNNDGSVDEKDVAIVKIYMSNGLVVNKGKNGQPQARLPWIDITTEIDYTAKIIYGETEWFSIFRGR